MNVEERQFWDAVFLAYLRHYPSFSTRDAGKAADDALVERQKRMVGNAPL